MSKPEFIIEVHFVYMCKVSFNSVTIYGPLWPVERLRDWDVLIPDCIQDLIPDGTTD